MSFGQECLFIQTSSQVQGRRGRGSVWESRIAYITHFTFKHDLAKPIAEKQWRNNGNIYIRKPSQEKSWMLSFQSITMLDHLVTLYNLVGADCHVPKVTSCPSTPSHSFLGADKPWAGEPLYSVVFPTHHETCRQSTYTIPACLALSRMPHLLFQTQRESWTNDSPNDSLQLCCNGVMLLDNNTSLNDPVTLAQAFNSLCLMRIPCW